MTILLIRHGAPDVDWETPLRRSAYRAWLARYEHASLLVSSLPSSALCAQVAAADVVYCSTLRRSKDSLLRAGVGKAFVSDAVFNEFALYALPVYGVCLLPRTWQRLSIWYWKVSLMLGWISYRRDRRRAKAALRLLIAAAERTGGRVVLFGHSGMNQVLCRYLSVLGWGCTAQQHPDAHWGWIEFAPVDTLPGVVRYTERGDDFTCFY